MLSATVIALNEEKDLPRCLESLGFADEIVVIDSGSTDRTVEIARAKGARVITEPWRGYGAQKNLAMRHATHPWVLNVDADEVVTPELRDEILREISLTQAAAGYMVARKTFYLGRWIRHGGWYPNYVTRLARKDRCLWSEPWVHEALQVDGDVRKLRAPLLHYTFSGVADQVRTNVRYAAQGALELRARGAKPSVARLVTKPLVKFIEAYFLKLGLLDGLPGFIIAMNAAHSVFMKESFLFDPSLEEQAREAKR